MNVGLLRWVDSDSSEDERTNSEPKYGKGPALKWAKCCRNVVGRLMI